MPSCLMCHLKLFKLLHLTSRVLLWRANRSLLLFITPAAKGQPGFGIPGPNYLSHKTMFPAFHRGRCDAHAPSSEYEADAGCIEGRCPNELGAKLA